MNIPAPIMWSPSPLGKTGRGRGLGNVSVLVSEFCRDPLDFSEVSDENTHEKGSFGKGLNPQFMLKWCMRVACSIHHMSTSVVFILHEFSFFCHLNETSLKITITLWRLVHFHAFAM